MPQTFDVAIIGGGVVGCALARQLIARFPKVLLLEKESSVGQHTSGRNSGVIHSGFNATPGTLKARLCVEGNKALRDYCRQSKVPMEEVGTLVVAKHAEEIPQLEALKAKGEKNGVPGLQIISGDELRHREPSARGEAALLSPTGSIVDSGALTQALAREASQRGFVLLNENVQDIKETPNGVDIRTVKSSFNARMAINCAGLHSDQLAHKMGVGRSYTVAPFRGEYFAVKTVGKPLVNSMLYDIPNPLFPFLGIHVTRTLRGTILLGPNAVPAFGREAYLPKAFNLDDVLELVSHRAFWNALLHNRELFNLGLRELKNSFSKQHFLKKASELVNGLTEQMLIPEAKVGIRAQLIRSDGTLVDDLIIERTPHSVHILNVVSPGMTSALAFARWISDRISNDFRWLSSVEPARSN